WNVAPRRNTANARIGMVDIAGRFRRFIPRRVSMFFMRTLFGLMPDGRRPGRSVAHNRALLATRYLHGDGIEIGALGRPLPLPPGARARQVDRLSKDDMSAHYPAMAKKRHVRPPDIVDDGETLASIPDVSQDFVVANHVIEHFEDPIRFLHNACRVLKAGGILFLAIPDKERTFDRNRPVTPFDHLVSDFENGAQISRAAHYREFVQLAELPVGAESWTTEAECETRAQTLMDQDYSIHFHVWDRFAVMDLVLKVRERFGLPLMPEAILSTGDEVILVLRKGGDGTAG
ncbi:MAG: methyltransferase domain-containing protein, partial [Rhodospirillales bacterium]